MNRQPSLSSRAIFNYCMLPFSFGKARRKRYLQHLQLKPRYTEGRIRLDGNDWSYPDSASFAHAYQEIIGKRIYQFKAADDRPNIIDCGANVGIASIYWKKLYPKAHITAIEADPKIFQFLLKNLEHTNCQDIVTVNKAVWHCNDSISFAADSADTGGITAYKSPVPNNEHPITVETVSLESLIGQQQVDLLKIDIEGAEVELLLKQADCLRYVQRIFVEYHSFSDQPQRIHELLRTLVEAGFRVHIHSEFISRRPFSNIHLSAGMDNRLNIYAWR